MEEYFYYLRDNANRPVITVCILAANDLTARGAAICSLRDSPCKRTGRAIAKGRALQALIKRSVGNPVRSLRALDAIMTVREDCSELHFTSGKYTYNPTLTPYEERLLNPRKETA